MKSNKLPTKIIATIMNLGSLRGVGVGYPAWKKYQAVFAPYQVRIKQTMVQIREVITLTTD